MIYLGPASAAERGPQGLRPRIAGSERGPVAEKVDETRHASFVFPVSVVAGAAARGERIVLQERQVVTESLSAPLLSFYRPVACAIPHPVSRRGVFLAKSSYCVTVAVASAYCGLRLWVASVQTEPD